MSHTDQRDGRTLYDASGSPGAGERRPSHVDAEPLYRLLGMLYLESPSSDVIDGTKEWLDRWATYTGPLPEEIEEPLKLMRAGVDDPTLKQQFTTLFMGIHANVSPRPPYESLYRDGTLFGPTSDTVLKRYRSVGLEVNEEVSGHPPDHLGFELHYLAELCEREREAIDRNDDPSVTIARRRQLEFLEEHLLSWFDDFRSECLSYHSGRFYRGVIELTDATLDAHVDSLRDLGVETGRS